eukprot:CAMPEP_0172795958 /NCGR_PEP_ID=MMETSP1074-20121228/210747_1 /TAXON_ID=2916 /ORGANISM="Ceratium fusus, Strain PA161109" /LENGTH=165 /DNA_ID=CAMNT_0013633049 /DNA_START=241 /DNA_END=738 /DNA_ORIENTATION=-
MFQTPEPQCIVGPPAQRSLAGPISLNPINVTQMPRQHMHEGAVLEGPNAQGAVATPTQSTLAHPVNVSVPDGACVASERVKWLPVCQVPKNQLVEAHTEHPLPLPVNLCSPSDASVAMQNVKKLSIKQVPHSQNLIRGPAQCPPQGPVDRDLWSLGGSLMFKLLQ